MVAGLTLSGAAALPTIQVKVLGSAAALFPLENPAHPRRCTGPRGAVTTSPAERLRGSYPTAEVIPR